MPLRPALVVLTLWVGAIISLAMFLITSSPPQTRAVASLPQVEPERPPPVSIGDPAPEPVWEPIPHLALPQTAAGDHASPTTHEGLDRLEAQAAEHGPPMDAVGPVGPPPDPDLLPPLARLVAADEVTVPHVPRRRVSRPAPPAARNLSQPATPTPAPDSYAPVATWKPPPGPQPDIPWRWPTAVVRAKVGGTSWRDRAFGGK